MDRPKLIRINVLGETKAKRTNPIVSLFSVALFRRHFPKLWRWCASWGWAGLIGLALTVEEAREYGIALSFAVLGAVSLAATCIRWAGLPGAPNLTKSVQILGSCMVAPLFLILSVIWIVGNRGTEPWSRIPSDWRFVVNSYVTSQYPDLPIPDKPIAPIPPVFALDKPQPTTSSVHPRISESRGTTEAPPPVSG